MPSHIQLPLELPYYLELLNSITLKFLELKLFTSHYRNIYFPRESSGLKRPLRNIHAFLGMHFFSFFLFPSIEGDLLHVAMHPWELLFNLLFLRTKDCKKCLPKEPSIIIIAYNFIIFHILYFLGKNILLRCNRIRKPSSPYPRQVIDNINKNDYHWCYYSALDNKNDLY